MVNDFDDPQATHLLVANTARGYFYKLSDYTVARCLRCRRPFQNSHAAIRRGRHLSLEARLRVHYRKYHPTRLKPERGGDPNAPTTPRILSVKKR